MSADLPSQIIHGTSVALEGRGALIIGKSGAGKSSLALHLMAFGAQLVADDRTCITHTSDGLRASCPDAISGMIEARGVGILRCSYVDSALLTCIVDLDRDEMERLPPPRVHQILDVTLPCLWRVAAPHFPAAILHYLRGAIPLGP